MKGKAHTFTLLTLLHLAFTGMAQTLTCSDFSVIGVKFTGTDPVVSIKLNAPASAFANYPHVLAVLDCNGNTVATGAPFFFGQLGQSTTDYPVTVSNSAPCEPLRIVFVYISNTFVSDTCRMVYNKTGLASTSKNVTAFEVLTNSATDHITIKNLFHQANNAFQVYDASGRLVLNSVLQSDTTAVDLSPFAAGLYVIRLEGAFPASFKVMKR